MKKGHIIHRYTAFSTTFEERRGWYRIPDEMAKYLATVHQVPNDEDTPLAFDVCTEEEARQIEAAERKKAEERARAAAPNVAAPYDIAGRGGALTTADLRDPNRRSRAPVPTGRRS
jgi:aminoglycoside phosphotransferase (APT) family kinase protein